MRIPYRTKKALGKLGIFLLILLAVGVVLWACWMIWLGRFVVYSRDGARLDFTLPQEISGTPAVPAETTPPVSVYYNEGENAINTNRELTKITGYYVELDQLRGDIASVKAQIQALPKEMAVLLDVKNIQGGYYYSSGVGEIRASSVDVAAVDDLIAYLKTSNRYAIARLPALRDYEYARTHVNEAISDRRGYVWVDSQRCYWLDPTKQPIINNLVQTVLELRNLGFDEVLLSDYDIPVDPYITFSADRTQALANLAQVLASTCINETFVLSFVQNPGFQLPGERCRLYIGEADAANAGAIAAMTGFADPAIQLVFLTENNDTRFEEYGVLRPLSSAH